MPLAETQMATVLSNADPQGKGRVRVRMNWQTDGMQTGWVRVMTPDGGSSSDVKSNRGFVFIPEVGDQVLLGFRMVTLQDHTLWVACLMERQVVAVAKVTTARALPHEVVVPSNLTTLLVAYTTR